MVKAALGLNKRNRLSRFVADVFASAGELSREPLSDLPLSWRRVNPFEYGEAYAFSQKC